MGTVKVPEIRIDGPSIRLLTSGGREIEQTLRFIPVFDGANDPLAFRELSAAAGNEIIEIYVHPTVTLGCPQHLSRENERESITH